MVALAVYAKHRNTRKQEERSALSAVVGPTIIGPFEKRPQRPQNAVQMYRLWESASEVRRGPVGVRKQGRCPT